MPPFDHLPLETPRLLLRPLRAGDAAALYALFSDPQAMRYWSTPVWTSLDQALVRIEKDTAQLNEGSALRLALAPRDASPLIGTVSLFAFDEQSRRASIGYILSPSLWGQGLMHEALSALVGYAFEQLAVRRLEADVDPRNQRSAKSLERLGFAREGFLRERWLVGSEVSDSALYGLLAKDWRRPTMGARSSDV